MAFVVVNAYIGLYRMATKSTTKPSKNGSANANAKTKPATSAPALAGTSLDDLIQQVTQSLKKTYKVSLNDRKRRVGLKVYHALREKMGLDLQAQVRKNNGNFDWQKWNTKVFVLLFGKPEAPKYSALVMAKIALHFYDSISADPEQAVLDLVEFNRQSLERRNAIQQETEDEELEDEEEEFDDSVLDDEDDLDAGASSDLDEGDDEEDDLDDDDEDFEDEDEELE